MTATRAPSPSPSSTLLLPLLAFLATRSLSHALSTPKSPAKAPPMKYAYRPDRKKYDGMRIASLHRYAVKGLSGDAIAPSVTLDEGDGTFEDDRRFALLYDTSGEKFDDADPDWLHKENFLCAFTAPELLATLDTEYRIESGSDDNVDAKRLLTVWNRESGRSSVPLLGPTDLARPTGRDATSQFFTKLCGREVRCVVANDNKRGSEDGILSKQRHTHQFGNTSSGIKNNDGDTRTIHIVNENTVRQFSEALYGSGDDGKGLTATRFRPNIVVDNLEPWAEFDLIGKTIEVAPKHEDGEDGATPLRFRVVSRTVRCAGVGVDPLHPELGVIDIPNLLSRHYPEHGPYLGVYAVAEKGRNGGLCGGTISVGDSFRVVEACDAS